MFNFDISVKFVLKKCKTNTFQDILDFVKEKNLKITKITKYPNSDDLSTFFYSCFYKNENYESVILIEKGAPFECLILFKKKEYETYESKILLQLLKSNDILIFCNDDYREFYESLIIDRIIRPYNSNCNESYMFLLLLYLFVENFKYFDFINEKIFPYYASVSNTLIFHEKIFIQLFKKFCDGSIESQIAFVIYLIQLLSSNQILDFENTKLADKFLHLLLRVINFSSKNKFILSILVLNNILTLIINKKLILDLSRKKGKLIKELNKLLVNPVIPMDIKQHISSIINKAMDNHYFLQKLFNN